MAIGLYIIGDEILSGRREDRHFAKVRDLLAARGMQLDWVQYLGDDPRRLAAAFATSFGAGEVALSCGGIGATPDDHTRAAAAAALGVPLCMHPQARALIEQRIAANPAFVDKSPEVNEQRLQMAVFPAGSDIVPNPYNQIAGFSIARHYFVPGFPVMAWPMLEWVLDNPLRELQGSGRSEERACIVRGAMEAELTALMTAVENAHPGVKVFSLPSVDDPTWGRHIELGVKGEPGRVGAAFDALKQGLAVRQVEICTDTVRFI